MDGLQAEIWKALLSNTYDKLKADCPGLILASAVFLTRKNRGPAGPAVLKGG